MLTDVSRADARRFLAHLEGEGYKRISIKKMLDFMKALTTFSVRAFELTLANPWLGLKAGEVAEQAKEKSFTYEQVRLLLSKTDSINDELAEITRVLPNTGARLAEISGLEVRDFDPKGRTINIRPNGVRSVKTKASIRVVPVVDPAALQAVASRCKGRQPDDPIWPRYGHSDRGSDAASATLGKWLKTMGFRSIHGLRHTVKDALREVGVQRDVANMIQGHTAGDVASQYGSSELVEVKREALTKVWSLILGRRDGIR